MKTLLLLLLRGYKLCVSPFLGQNCRFYPSCSDYAQQAVAAHGALRGSLLAGRRLCKCHPWHAGGLDPVPPAEAVPAPVPVPVTVTSATVTPTPDASMTRAGH